MASETVRKNIVFNLRNHPRKEIAELSKEYDDAALYQLYEHFAETSAHGNNDENFVAWVKGTTTF